MSTPDTPDPLLQPHFAALRAGLAGHEAPAAVEAALLAAFRQRHPPRRWYHRLTRISWSMATGVGSTAALVLVFLLSLRSPADLTGEGAAPRLVRDNGTAFIALDSQASIEAADNAQVVAADLPKTALAAAGVAVPPEAAGDTVRAELLVAPDGKPLALRLLSSN